MGERIELHLSPRRQLPRHFIGELDDGGLKHHRSPRPRFTLHRFPQQEAFLLWILHLHQPPGSPACKPPEPRRCEGVVAKNQCFPGEMCSEGLLVEVSPDVFAETSFTRRFEKVGNKIILLHWYQILL